MRILLSGASGLIGRALAKSLSAEGDSVVSLVRREPNSADEIRWNPAARTVDRSKLAGIDAVISLSGESIATRWSPAVKERLSESRIGTTKFLVEALGSLPTPPRHFLSASAVGIYGSRSEERLDETSSPGNGFLAELTSEWEEAARGAERFGARSIQSRLGVVLSSEGGALAKMLPAFRLGAGGPVGSGRQYMSWISIDDAVRAFLFILRSPALSGPVNVTSPEPVANADFARTLGRVLKRPAVLPLPAAAVRLMFGEMGESLLLSGAKVYPAKLLAAGFTFETPLLEDALRIVLRESIKETT